VSRAARRVAGLVALLAALAAPAASAHPLAPALLEIAALASGHYAITWRTSVSSVARGARVEPRFDARCRAATPVETRLEDGEALVSRWTLDCGPAGLSGTRLKVSSIDRAGISVVVRWRPSAGAGAIHEQLLDARHPARVLPAATASRGPVMDYATLGLHHLAIGADHLLFLAGLIWIVRAWRARVLALSAFTLGHGITFALAALDRVRIDPALAETGIAATLLLLGAEILRPRRGWIGRLPATAALVFGLVHGLGFAGALREAGLPPADTARAVLGFHLGIEAGQIAFVLGLAGTAALLRRVPPALSHAHAARTLAAYGIGAVAAYWFLERATAWMA
jgi:hypothetical protein